MVGFKRTLMRVGKPYLKQYQRRQSPHRGLLGTVVRLARNDKGNRKQWTRACLV